MARLLAWTEAGLELAGEAATAEEAAEACRRLRPEVALVDLSLGLDSGAGDPATSATAGDGITGQLLAAHEGLAVVGLCDPGREQADDQGATAMRAGARGCVDIDVDGPELAQAVVAAARGQAVLSGPMLRQLRRGLRAEEGSQARTRPEARGGPLVGTG